MFTETIKSYNRIEEESKVLENRISNLMKAKKLNNYLLRNIEIEITNLELLEKQKLELNKYSIERDLKIRCIRISGKKL